MNDLTVFDFESYKVRVVVRDGEPWWVLKDVCCVLDLSSPHKVAERLDEDERSLIPLTDSIGRLQETTAVNESGLYSVIIRSDKPEAKRFRKWVTSEVLPSIRKHGAYMTPETLENLISNPDFGIRLLEALKEERQKVARLKTVVEKKTLQLDESKQYYTVKRVAKLNGIDWRKINWKRLKDTSNYLQCEVKKIFDVNYGNVNAYHIDVWMNEYPELVYLS